SDEVNKNQSLLQLLPDMMLQCREVGVELVNDFFNLDIEVMFNSIWKTEDEVVEDETVTEFTDDNSLDLEERHSQEETEEELEDDEEVEETEEELEDDEEVEETEEELEDDEEVEETEEELEDDEEVEEIEEDIEELKEDIEELQAELDLEDEEGKEDEDI